MKRTVVTGAASGIGFATAEMLARDGHALILVDRDEGALQTANARLSGAAASLVCPGSVLNEETVRGVVELAVKEFGGIDGLVTSAGLVRVAPSLEVELNSFREQMEVNVIGSWLYAQVVGRQMVSQGAGSIVMIGSVYGVGGAPDRAAYCASKGAVHNLVHSLAVEWGPLGVRVNAVAPTGVRTPMVQNLIDKGQYNLTGVQARTPLGRLAEPDEVASGCRFLLSDEAKMITGHILAVDGGWLANGYTSS